MRDPHSDKLLSVERPGWSVSSLSVSGTPYHTTTRERVDSTRKTNPYPDRLVQRSSIPSNIPNLVLEDWATSVEFKLGPLVPSAAARRKTLCLLYHYRHLNGTDLTDLPCTDLITHRIRLTPGTKPSSIKVQKKWPIHTEWWLRKIITDGMKRGVYELSEPANGRLFMWNARAVVVDKVDNATPDYEPRVTFDYSK